MKLLPHWRPKSSIEKIYIIYSMKIIKTKFKDLRIIKHNKFSDHRGFLNINYNRKFIKWDSFVFDYISHSKKNVFRGFHFQYKKQQSKLISVIKGEILDLCN